MMNSPKTLFVVHSFGQKPLADSPAILEVVNPMLASGLLGETEFVEIGSQDQDLWTFFASQVEKFKCEFGDKPVVIYSAGSDTKKYFEVFDGLNIVALADKDETKWQKTWEVNGKSFTVVSPEKIRDYTDTVIVSNRGYEVDIIRDLTTQFDNQLTLFPLYGDTFFQASQRSWQDKIKTVFESFKPELLVHTPTYPKENLPAEFFLQLKTQIPSLKIATLWWDFDEDDPQGAFLNYEREVLRYANFIADNSNGTRIERMQKHEPPYGAHTNADKVYFHPTVFDPAIFHPRKVAFKYDIAVFGNSFGHRKTIIDFLKSEYPKELDMPAFYHIGGVQEANQYVSTEDYALALCQTKVCINTQTYANRIQCKGKVREALACSVFLLEEDNPETRLLLKDGEGVVYFSGLDDLKQKIDFYLANPDERLSVIQRGQQKVQQSINAKGWTKRLLENL